MHLFVGWLVTESQRKYIQYIQIKITEEEIIIKRVSNRDVGGVWNSYKE